MRKLPKIVNEADTVLALVIAIGVGILGLTSVASDSVIQNAILVTLGILSVSILRDRWRRGDATDETLAGLREVSAALASFRQAQTTIDEMRTTLGEARVALNSQALVHGLTTAQQVADECTQARETSSRWIFRGGTGTYIRAVTLPGLVSVARKERRPLQVRLEILDPTNEDVCDRYASFRYSISPNPDGIGEIWTKERTQLESYATLLAACWYQLDYTLLDIKVALTSIMGVFRYDMSDSRIVITQDDGGAIVVPQKGFLYKSYETELANSFEQARKVDLAPAKRVRLSVQPTPGEVINVFAAINIPLVVSHDLVPDIIEKAIHARNPYI
ncbi:hypothetical protein [Herbidospora sp. RD11066]